MKKFTILVIALFIHQSTLASSADTEALQQKVAKEKLNGKISSKDVAAIRVTRKEVVTQPLPDKNDEYNDLKPLKIGFGGTLYLIYDKDAKGKAMSKKIKVTRIQGQGSKKKTTRFTISQSTFLEIKKISDDLKHTNHEVNKIEMESPNANEQFRALAPNLNLKKMDKDMDRLSELLQGRKRKKTVYKIDLKSGGVTLVQDEGNK